MRRLEAAGRLKRIAAPVSSELEVTEIHRRVLAAGGPALLFENLHRPDGSPWGMPTLANLFGTVERVAWGIGREPGQLREVGEALAFLRQPEPPGGWREAAAMLPLLRSALAMKPRTVGSAPVQEVELRGSDIDLGRLPVQDLLAGRAGAADHLAAGRHQGSRRKAGGRLQSRGSTACR